MIISIISKSKNQENQLKPKDLIKIFEVFGCKKNTNTNSFSYIMSKIQQENDMKKCHEQSHKIFRNKSNTKYIITVKMAYWKSSGKIILVPRMKMKYY